MAPKPLRLLVSSASGRMGARAAELAARDARFSLSGALGRRTSAAELTSLVSRADVLVDFSAPNAALKWARACAAAGTACVIGTTGFSSAQSAELERLARKTPLFVSPNFSPGMAVLVDLVETAARCLPGFEAAIVETHHSRKKDVPSGTALRLARALERTRRGAKTPVSSLRVGDVVGDHTVVLAGPFERLELTHRAQSRDVFAKGALEAALWLAGRKPGLYGMEDLLR